MALRTPERARAGPALPYGGYAGPLRGQDGRVASSVKPDHDTHAPRGERPGRAAGGASSPGAMPRRRSALAAVLLSGPAALALPACRARREEPDERLAYKATAQGELRLDWFRAAGSKAAPALLLFHGGAWAHGSPRQFHPLCRHLAARGLHALSAEYRLRDRHHSSPADAVQDARDAMRHLRREAGALGIDRQRIAAGGGSAGGHLAACLGTGVSLPDPGADPALPVRPSALVLLNPMLDLGPGRPDHALVGARWRELSPRQHVGPGMPPTLIVNGTADIDVPVATVQDFCTAARAHSGDCEAVFREGAGHGFFNTEVDRGRHVAFTWAAIEAFLRRVGHLKPSLSS